MRIWTLGLLAACSSDTGWPEPEAPTEPTSEADLGERWFEKETLLPTSTSLRDVGFSAQGPPTTTLTASSAVWTVSRRWDELDPAPGIAWPANSTLTWDQKYSAWVDSLVTATSDDGHATVEVVTPWGRRLPSPRVECAELAMFLRVTFAAWYNLPFFMSAVSPGAGTVHYGHFGLVDNAGRRLNGTPNFATSYADYTPQFAGQSNAQILANWPNDATLETRGLTTDGDDRNEFLGEGALAGAYFDEVHLNKRVGYFLLRLLPNFGSINFADPVNLWNLQPEGVREGDVLLHRWQAQGIGHVMVVKEVDPLTGGNLDAQIVFGSMPRIQPKWYNASVSKSYFTAPYSGGAETASDGTPYSRLGGGLKRWRTPQVSGGRWVNVVPVSDRGSYVADTDYPAIEARPVTFRSMLGNLSPAEQRDVLVEQIETARSALRQRPASCANRQRREQAFDELYDLMSREWGWSRTRVDETYRSIEDYAFPELEYASSPTCCWNSTTSVMADIVIRYETERAQEAFDNGQCLEPVGFFRRNGGYEPYASYAASIGRAGDWRTWSEDETCAQRGNVNDLESNTPWAAFCDIDQALLGDEDTDTDPEDTDTDPVDPGPSPDCGGCNAPNVPLLPLAAGLVLAGRRRRR